MNGNFENMIKRYKDELLKMNREKALPDPEPVTDEVITESTPVSSPAEALSEETTREPVAEPEEPTEAQEENTVIRNRADIDDIPGIEQTDFYNAKANEPDFSLEEPENFARFSARVFTGNNAYPIENARVLVIKNNKLFTFLSTDSDGVTKRIKLPSYPEKNSLNPESDEQYVEYTGEVYAKGFTPKKNLLISAVGGSDIILDVQMTPEEERVN